MKKSLIALAALAATASFAQSTATISGSISVGVMDTGAAGATAAVSTLGGGANAINIVTTEDLGGGMSASFWLEAGLNIDNGVGQASNTNNQAGGLQASNGGLTFNRRSTVSLNGSFGEVRLGRDYTPQFWTQTAYDPFGTVGVGANIALTGGAPAANLTGVRASNSIGYLSPKFNGFGVWAQTYMGENKSDVAAPADKKTGSGNGVRVTYDNGPLSLALANSSTDTGVGTTWKATNIGGSYDLGVAKILALSTTDKPTGALDIKGNLIGATMPMGAGTIKLSQSQTKQGDNKSDKTAIGYVYGLSKRTSLYATYASVKNSGAAKVSLGGTTGAAGVSSTGMDLGVTHAF